MGEIMLIILWICRQLINRFTGKLDMHSISPISVIDGKSVERNEKY
jgi:hypothetical protein